MPELPEVETIRLGLSKYLVGQTVAKVELINRSSFQAADPEIDNWLIGARITKIRRRAKMLVIDLSSDYSLIIHLKMTGQLVYDDKAVHYGAGHPTDSLVHKLPDRSTRVIIGFKSGATLYFNDQRKFGWLKLLPAQVLDSDVFNRLGPEPLSPQFTPAVLGGRLKRRARTSIKAALLDQTVVAGVGNIYADEALWGAKIHPATLVAQLSQPKIKLLHQSLVDILKLAIKSGGSSDRNYVNADGQKGSYLSFARVYHRQGQPCPRCGRPIKKTRVAGRGTHFCSFCQRLPKR